MYTFNLPTVSEVNVYLNTEKGATYQNNAFEFETINFYQLKRTGLQYWKHEIGVYTNTVFAVQYIKTEKQENSCTSKSKYKDVKTGNRDVN